MLTRIFMICMSLFLFITSFYGFAFDYVFSTWVDVINFLIVILIVFYILIDFFKQKTKR